MPQQIGNLFDSFDLYGDWWLGNEDSERRSRGILSFIGQERIELTLENDFPTAPSLASSNFVPEVIYGFSPDGERYTLLRTMKISEQVYGMGNVRAVYKVRVLIIGAHSLSFSDPQIVSVRFRFPGLEQSTALKWFKVDFSNLNDVAHHWVKPTEFEVWVPSLKSHVSTYFTFDRLGDLEVTNGQEHKAFLQLKPLKLMSLNVLWGKIFQLQRLLILLHGLPSPTSEMQMELCDGETVQLFFPQGKSGVRRTYDRSELSVSLFSLTRREREALFQNWFEARQPVQDAAELFCGTVHQLGIFTTLEFVNHIQTLEAFHRAVFRSGGVYVTKGAYIPVRDALIRAIPNTVGSAHRSKLVSAISYGYEKSQAKRIEELIFSLPKSFRQMWAVNEKVFVRKLVDTRNRYTHYAEGDQARILTVFEMAVCNLGLRVLIQFLFLRYLGIKDKQFMFHLQRNENWRKYRNTKTW
ncbi:MAG: HEPN domain-containing protein [Candidatus Obscuribacterales bacterium]